MTKQNLVRTTDELAPLCSSMCKKLWENPECGGYEKESADYLRGILRDEGFIIVNEEKLKHAFYAEYGSGKPVIAILGEYDALPGLSQKVVAHKEPAAKGKAGQACGHNLLGSGSATAAIALKRYLEEEEVSGTIRFYGCPEEELLSGKVKMAYFHMFHGCDLAISWHPMCATVVYDEGYLANASVKFHFKGKTSHAAFAPERGRSALDAVELMSVASNYLREHIIDKARIHYTTDSGGLPPNVVPDHASSWYFARAPYMSQVRDILRRLELNARGAAMMTETEVTVEKGIGCYEMRCNHAFADLTHKNMEEVGALEYTEEEKEFAGKLQETVDEATLSSEQKLYGEREEALASGIYPRDFWKQATLNSSSDSGDISQIMPMNMFTTPCWPIGCAPHTWQAAASTGSSIGAKGALHAAKIIVGIVYDLLNDPEATEKIMQEFRQLEDNGYQPMFEE